MKGIALTAPTLLALALLPACEDGGGAAVTSSTSSTTGGNATNPIAWEALPEGGAPEARHRHTAVWTGSKMIIWGGAVAGAPGVTATGGAYDPEARAWSPTAAAGAPSARQSHTAVWTGSKMIVWGGFGESALAADGGIYDPATDTWSPMSTAGQPEPRMGHTASWTGNLMVVWGGQVGVQTLMTGGAYDPAKDAWTPMSAMGAPSPRHSPAAAWTGSAMVVWGGTDFADWLKTGGIWSPASGSGGQWTSATNQDGAPTARQSPVSVWGASISRMLLWGGWTGGPYEGSGAMFDPSAGPSGAWEAMTMDGAPSPRGELAGAWTGSDLVVWGGCGEDLCGKVYGDGGRFTPGDDGGKWTAIEEQAALTARRGHTAVATESSIIVWGGRVGSNELLGSGAESLF